MAHEGLVDAVEELKEVLEDESAQPLALPTEEACRFLLQTYSRRHYPAIAQSLLNTPMNVDDVNEEALNVAATLLPRMIDLRGMVRTRPSGLAHCVPFREDRAGQAQACTRHVPVHHHVSVAALGQPLKKLEKLIRDIQPNEMFYMTRLLAKDHLRPFTRCYSR